MNTESLRKLMTGEFSSLTISFNDFACNYVDAREAVRIGALDDDEDFWVSPEEREKALAMNSVWEIQWYPKTPVGFCRLQASTLEAVVVAALQTLETCGD